MLNVANLDRLISYLSTLNEDHFHMRYVIKERHPCGTACCISGHLDILEGRFTSLRDFLGLGNAINAPAEIMMPDGWCNEKDGNKAYPLSRALRMLKFMRAEYLRTGNVVVNWDAPETAEPARQPWAPPVVIAADKALPASLTSLLREPVP